MTVSLPIGRRATKCLIPGAAGIYLLNEGSGTALLDHSGNGNDGTLGAGGAAPTWTADGLSFDGGDLVTLPETLAGATACTVLMAMNVTSTAANAGYFSGTGNDGTNGAYTISLRRGSEGDYLNLRASDGTNRAGVDSSSIAESGGDASYRLAVVRYIGSTSLEVGFAPEPYAITSTSVPAALNAAPSGTPAIGRHDAYYLTGGVAALLIYRSALTDAQIAQNKAALAGILAPRGITLA